MIAVKLQVQSADLGDYLERTPIINFDHHKVVALATQLKNSVESELDLIKRTFEYVRDEIHHTADIAGKIVTCKASEVLAANEGICYAKSHLLAALLRYHGIPVGFCYQLLWLDDQKSSRVIHGLNAVYLNGLQRWIRLDARGNKPGVDAQFNTESEKLAFPVRAELGETDYPIIFVNPDQNVMDALMRYTTVEKLWANLPQNLSPF